MGDPFDRNLVAAGSISSSQEEILRSSLFVRSGGSRSSSSSSSFSGGAGPGGAPYWISHRPVTMRSASDSHHSSSSPSSSDARSCGGRGGSEVAQSPGAEESVDGGDGGERSGLPENRADRIVGRVKRKKSCVSKKKGAAEGRTEKRSRPLSEESTQEPEGSPVVSPRGKVVGRRLGFSRIGKEAVEAERGDGDSRTDPPGVEDEGGDRSATDAFSRFRYVRTGVPPLRHSPLKLLKDALGGPHSARGGVRSPPLQMSPVALEPADGEVVKGPPVKDALGSPHSARGGVRSPPLQMSPMALEPADGEVIKGPPVKDALGSPHSARGGVRSPPLQMSPVALEPADGEVIKGPPVRSPQGSGKGAMGLNSPSPSTPDGGPDGERGHGSGASATSHASTPLGASPGTSIQLQNSVEPEEEGPPSPAMGLGSSSPVETPQQLEGQRAVEKSPSGDALNPAAPTESAPGGEDMEVRCHSDLVDLLIKFSKEPDRRLQYVDFLDVLEMKGIHIPPPRWWRPGGYAPKKK